MRTPPASRTVPWPSRVVAVPLVRSLVFALAYTGAVVLGRQTVVPETGFALVWPAAGVAALWFAAQRRARTTVADALLLATATVGINAASGAPVAMSVSFAAGNLTLATSFRWSFARWCPGLWGAGGDRALSRLREVDGLLRAAVVAAACSAPFGPVGAALLGYSDPSAWSLLNWVVRNAVSVVLLVSAGQSLVAARSRRASSRPGRRSVPRHVEAAVAVAVSLAVYVAVFTFQARLPLAFLPIAVVVWVAARAHTSVVLAHDVVAAGVVAFATVNGLGPFALVADPVLRGLVAQSFTTGACVVGLVLAVGRDERVDLLRTLNRRAAEAAEDVRRTTALAEAARQVATADDAREAICRAAADITGADGVYLLEPAGPHLVTTCVVGVDLPPVTIAVDAEQSLTAACFRDRTSAFVPDVAGHPGVSTRLVQQLSVASAAWFPVVQRDRSVGVLGVVWRERVDELHPSVPVVLDTLASEAAVAVERADLLARLARAADHDQLTGLANRRRWDELAAAEVDQATRQHAPLTFLLLDLDRFKDYNDTFGHLEGDGLLREFAAAAAQCLREVDVLARWGGEEFAVALPDCSPEDAVRVADRIRAAVPRGQTCTVGVAGWTPGQTHEDVLARADAALYDGKRAGRDRSVLAGPPVPVDARDQLPTP